MATRRTKSTAPVEAQEELELEADEVEEEAPAPKAKKAKAEKAPKAPVVEFGTKELAAHINEECGTSYDPYNLRILMRKLAKEGIINKPEGEGRTRYTFTGPKDPQVKAIVKAIKEGAAEKAKAERLETLKEQRIAGKKNAAAKKAKAKVAKDVEPEVEDDDDLEVDDL